MDAHPTTKESQFGGTVMQVDWLARAQDKALRAAKAYLGQCAPNPAVGAVVLQEGVVIACAAHTGSGFPHAEVLALQQAGEMARGATLLVTLEPCCHYGRTPPCTDRIIASGISQVFFCYFDPDPRVQGKGQQFLRAAGIDCDFIPSPDVASFYESYAHWVKQGHPYVHAKLALTADGKTAAAHGEPVNITGCEVAAWTARKRQQMDAIITTVKTIHSDDPRLNVRLDGAEISRPVIVLDTRLECPIDARIWQTASSVVLCHQKGLTLNPHHNRLAERGTLQALPTDTEGYLSWSALMRLMGGLGYHNVLLEAGATSLLSLLKSSYLNEFHLSLTTKTLGEKGMTAFVKPYNFTDNARSIEWQCIADTAIASIKYP